MGKPQPYDAIAARYRDSKQLPFRHVVERYTLFQSLGDLRGRTVVDFGCREGIHVRRFRRAGAAAVTGVDNSTEMIAPAEAEERADPLSCRYVCGDAAEYVPAMPLDVVTAVYLLNYPLTADEVAAFCRACFRSLRPGGWLVGFSDNVRRPPLPGRSLAQVRIRTYLPPSSGGGRHHTLPDHQPGRPGVRDRQLLSAAGHLRSSDARRRDPGLPLDRRLPGSVRTSTVILGRFHGAIALHRIRRDKALNVVSSDVSVTDFDVCVWFIHVTSSLHSFNRSIKCRSSLLNRIFRSSRSCPRCSACSYE